MYKIPIIEDDLTMAQAIQKRDEDGETTRSTFRILKTYLKLLRNLTRILFLWTLLCHFTTAHWCSEIRKISNVPVILFLRRLII